jgi:hypothetical protein
MVPQLTATLGREGSTGVSPAAPDQDRFPCQRSDAAVPSAGFEPTHTAPEADALSPELRGQEGTG